jgi:predicted metal-binding membrane protein
LSRSLGIARLVTVAALVAVAAVCWGLLVRSGAVMSAMAGEGVLMEIARAMMQPAATAPYLIASALMWLAMMSAMMTPALLPVLFVFLRLDRDGRRGRADGALFASGYLLVWLAFGLVATVLQWGLHRAALLHAHVLFVGPALAGSLLLAAGLYQLTPLKTACLAHCQTPLGFIFGHWRDGRRGALVMGVHHGGYCLGCCWALMLLMFVGGVMSVAAMAVLSLFILAERLVPPGPWAAKVPGVALISWGVWTLAQAYR